MTTYERLQEWSNTLSTEQLKSIVVNCIDRLIDTEDIGFYDGAQSPYWNNSGDRLDGIE